MTRGAGVEVVTFGCRLNALESEVIRRQAERAGCSDTVVVNTCAVTAEAVRQARQSIRALRRERPRSRIVVTGCAAQIDPQSFAAMPETDQILGNAEKLEPDVWAQGHDALALKEHAAKTLVGDIMAARTAAALSVDGFAGRSRAFVQVQNGCDHRCTFCVIPFGRGNSRSVPVEAVVENVRRLVANGYPEVVLTGVDITSYGADGAGTPGLGALVQRILKEVPDLARLRLSSIDAVEADRDLLDALAGHARLMPHLHLSLQSGDDLILKRMKRRHSRADAIAFCEQVRRLRPDALFGADLIAGFPTETEAMFRNSLALIAECGLAHLHVFPFSPRPGTPAARMPQVARDAVTDRARRLRECGAAAFVRHLDGEIGATRRVLAESATTGRTEQFTKVLLPRPAEPGQMLDVKIAGHDGRQLLAAWDNIRRNGDRAMDASGPDYTIATTAQLESLYSDTPYGAAVFKETDRITAEYRKLIEASPFCVVATSGPEGLDCSPRGDPAGFVRVVDEHTLLIPDRRGNNRIDSLRNLVGDPRISLLFLIPGVSETMRINGRAIISADPALTESFTMNGKVPKSVLVVTVERAYFQCAKALVRSKLWDEASKVDRKTLPTSGTILAELTGGKMGGPEHDRLAPERIKQTIY